MEDCAIHVTKEDHHWTELGELSFASDQPTKTYMLYSLSGVLDYLQSEWSRMEVERAGWAVERAEMQARIAFLKGECKAQENLKTDLVRRIKMLEHALIQERNKNFELKYPNESKPIGPKPDGEKSALHHESGLNICESNRVHLKDCLVQAGLGDTMEQFRRARVHELMSAITADDSSSSDLRENSTIFSVGLPNDEVLAIDQKNPTERVSISTAESPGVVSIDRPATTLPETFPCPTEFVSYLPNLDHTPEISDPETAEALAEFDLFVSQQKVNGRIPSNLGESSASTLSEITSNLPPVYSAWDSMDEKELMIRLKEKYHAKQFRDGPRSKEDGIFWRSSSPSDGPGGTVQSESEYQLGVLSAGEDIDVKRPLESIYSPSTTAFSIDELEEAARDYDSVLSTTSPSHSQQDMLTNSSLHATIATIGSKTPLPIVSSVPASIGLGDLARLTVANESDPGHLQNVAAAMDNLDGVCVTSHSKVAVDESYCSRNSTSLPVETAPWTAKYTLRSHFDAIRCIKFHPTEPMLVTASEDHTLKLWNLNKTVQAKKSNSFDVEPIYTFRGHNAPVLSLSMVTQPESSGSFSLVVFSGDLHGNLRSWRLSNLHWDPYDTFDPTINGPLLRGHSDAIWSLVTRPDGYLLSVSADGTACLWPTAAVCTLYPPSSVPTGRDFQLTETLMTALATRSVEFGSKAPVPTSVDFVQTDRNHFLAGFTSGHIGLFDIETNQLISTFYSTESSPNEVTSPTLTAVTCVLSHPLHSLAVSAFEDRHIRFFDTNSGKCTHTMVAHLDAVTSLDVDPHGTCLISGSHDCSIRLWNINKKTCIQEITSHRKKFGESIHAVAFHASKHLMASAGSDALAKVFV